MRNWPYCYALAQKAPETKGKFAVAPFPAFEGGGKAGILGGANLVISTFSKNPGASLKFIDYMTHPERQSEDIVKFSDASPLKAVYEDPAVQKAQPFSDELKKAVEQAKSRPGLARLLAGLGGDLQERQQGAVGQREPRGGAEEGADRHGEGARDVLMAAELVVLERGVPLGFSFRDLMSYHGPGSPGGVAHGFKVMERALPLLEPGGPPERREIEVATAFGGPGARDAFELVTRAVTDGRYDVDAGLALPERGWTRERFVFRLRYRGATVTLGVCEGFVTEEFLTLARTERPSAEQTARLDVLKREMAERVMASPASEVYEPVSLTGCPDSLFSSASPAS